MAEFKGTKGNWITFCNDETKEYSVGGGNDERYFICKIHTTGRDIETCRANTNLIASSPELLDFIKKYYRYLNLEDQKKAEKLIEKATKL